MFAIHVGTTGKTKDKDFYCDPVKQPLSVDEVQLICREHEEVMTA